MRFQPLEKGQLVSINNIVHRCDGRGPRGRYKLINVKKNSATHLAEAQIVQMAAHGRLSLLQAVGTSVAAVEAHDSTLFDLSSLSAGLQAEVRRRHHYCKAVHTSRETSPRNAPLSDRGLASLVSKQHQMLLADWSGEPHLPQPVLPSTRSVIRWYRDYEKSGFDLAALVPSASGNTLDRLDPLARDLLEQTIDQEYLHPQQLDLKKVHQKLGTVIRLKNRTRRDSEALAIPSYKAMLASLERRDGYEVLAARKGVPFAKKIYHVRRTTPLAERPLERVQMDHTQMDIRVDFGCGLIIRPWITLALDVCTRAIVGFHLGAVPPSYETVMACLHHAICKKDPCLAAHGSPDLAYPMYGIPSELLVDNGKEFRGDDLKNACAHLGVTLTFTPPRQPWFKAQVERVFRTVNQRLLIKTTGRVFRKIDEAPKKDEPYIALENFQKIMLLWVTENYHRQPHPAIANSPLAAWREWESKGVIIPADEGKVKVYLASTETRTLSQRGIQHLNNYYDSERLLLLRRCIGHVKVQIKHSPDDVSRIFVLDPNTKEYFEVLANRHEELEGRSEHAHRVVMAEARRRGFDLSNDQAAIDGEIALERLIDESTPKAKSRAASKLARFQQGRGKKNTRGPLPELSTREKEHAPVFKAEAVSERELQPTRTSHIGPGVTPLASADDDDCPSERMED